MAVAMRAEVAQHVTAWAKRGHRLGFGVGIAHGDATLGTIGFEGRRDYAAIGPVTNLASRLCEEAQAGEMLPSQRAFTAVEDDIETDPPRELSLEGFHRSVLAYNVRRLRP
jgi:class 3 adenylate cyclase